MKRLVVNGGRQLRGEVIVGGSKNAALPIIFACILTNGISKIENLPDIGDVAIALSLLRSFGAEIENQGSTTLIDTRKLTYRTPDSDLTSKIRASTYLLGSCLGRFGICHLQTFGGCNFSDRPIDMHLDACKRLGASINDDTVFVNRPSGNSIEFAKPSVGATVNAILLSATAEGESHISGCAVEPHIDALIDFLNSCGADITRIGREIRVVGRRLHGGRIRIIGDMIEAGSYLTLGLMCEGDITVKNAPIDHMTSFLDTIARMGAQINIADNCLSARLDKKTPISIATGPYPEFPTDLQPIIAPLMALCSGGEITDNVWPDRFGYLKSLSEFGIISTTKNNTAIIYPSKIHSGTISAPDLRGGMACLMTALAAKGRSEILSLDTILRGYEDLEEKFALLGADIKIIE